MQICLELHLTISHCGVKMTLLDWHWKQFQSNEIVLLSSVASISFGLMRVKKKGNLRIIDVALLFLTQNSCIP